MSIILLVNEDTELLTVEALEAVAHLDTMYSVGAEDLERQLIEHVLDVLDTVEMTVVVDIAVEWHEHSGRLGSLHASTAHALYGTGFIATVGSELAIVESSEVCWLACLHVDECPGGTGMAEDTAVMTEHAEVTRGEEAVDTLYPGFHVVGVALVGVFVDLDGEAREHPGLAIGTEAFLAKAALVGMVAGSDEHLIGEEAK